MTNLDPAVIAARFGPRADVGHLSEALHDDLDDDLALRVDEGLLQFPLFLVLRGAAREGVFQ